MADPWPYPFSSAVKAGNFIFLSGQIGSVVENGAPVLVKGGIDPEARQARQHQGHRHQSRLVDGSRRQVLGHARRHERVADVQHDLRDTISR